MAWYVKDFSVTQASERKWAFNLLQPEYIHLLNLTTTSFLCPATYVVCIHRRIKASESVVYAPFQWWDSEGLIAKKTFFGKKH